MRSRRRHLLEERLPEDRNPVCHTAKPEIVASKRFGVQRSRQKRKMKTTES
jgi:hypothetical protein